jgi:hypothetical protein
VAEGDIKVECSLSERFGEVSIVLGAIKTARLVRKTSRPLQSRYCEGNILIVQLEADPEDGIRDIIFSYPDIEQRLTEVTA